jgi:hypothetical protein
VSHPHEHHEHAPQHGHRHEGSKIAIHKDWRLWIGVLLMLGAMLVYVLTLDESVRPSPNPPKPPTAGAKAK